MSLSLRTKTGAAVHKQAPVVVANLHAVMQKRPLSALSRQRGLGGAEGKKYTKPAKRLITSGPS